MSRSYRKTRVVGNVNLRDSEKSDKQRANRALRRNVNQRLPQMDYDADVLPIAREVSNVWGWSHDGKKWIRSNRWYYHRDVLLNSDEWWQRVRRWK